MDTDQKLQEFLGRYSDMDEDTLKEVVDSISV